MKHRVSNLEGARLDAAVAMAAGHLGFTISEYDAPTRAFCHVNGRPFAPSAEWATGGPIIERERIAHYECDPGQWRAGFNLTAGDGPGVYLDCEAYGATPLIAAMRAFVANKFGEEIDL